MSLLNRIKHRALELMIVKGVSRAEATRLAANTTPPKPKTTQPAISTDNASSAKEQLFKMIFGIRDWMPALSRSAE